MKKDDDDWLPIFGAIIWFLVFILIIYALAACAPLQKGCTFECANCTGVELDCKDEKQIIPTLQ